MGHNGNSQDGRMKVLIWLCSARFSQSRFRVGSFRHFLVLPRLSHRLTALVGRREGTGPFLCFGPSVHASGRQGQTGPLPRSSREVARRASSVGTAHSVHSPAPGGGRNEE